MRDSENSAETGIKQIRRNIDRDTVVSIAAQYGHTEMVRCLVQEFHAPVGEAMFPAITYGQTETVRMLVQECGADVTSIALDDDDGYSAGEFNTVILAAWEGRTETARMLVKLGADVAADRRGRTPVWIAASNGHTETVRMLLQECRINVNAVSTHGNTALIVAAKHGHIETVRVLVHEFHAALDVQNNAGKTAVLAALCEGNVETARVLVQECGANASIADNNGVTPIMVAAQYQDGSALWMLTRQCGVPPSERRRQLAFGMGLHARLGNGSVVSRLDPELLGMILQHLPVLASKSTHLAATNAAKTRMKRNVPLLRWMEAIEDRAPEHAEANDTRRKNLEEQPCPVCLEVLEPTAIALVPCGHRMCPVCWETFRARNIRNCPYRCPRKILWGGQQNMFPDQHALYSRFCVELAS